ncbi:MAG: hypothetical protein AAFP26_04845 [Planctomycetota bacterium]
MACAASSPAALLDDIERAVLARDAGRLIALAEIEDHALRLEHERWAIRVAADPPDVFELTLRSVAGQRVSVGVHVAWGERVYCADRSAWVVARAWGRGQTAWGGWVSPSGEAAPTSDRLRVRGAGVDAHVCAQVEARWAEARAAAAGVIGAPVPGALSASIYPDPAALALSIPIAHDDASPVLGWHERGETIRLAMTPGGVEAMTPVLAHEAAHAAQFALGAAGERLPRWATEGLGELAADRVSARADRAHELCAIWLRDATLEPWGALDRDPLSIGGRGARIYAQGLSMVSFIERTRGVDALHAWVRALAQGTGLDVACERALGLGFDRLDGAWRAWLIERD